MKIACTGLWDETQQQERLAQEELRSIGNNWPEIKNLLGFLDQYKAGQ